MCVSFKTFVGKKLQLKMKEFVPLCIGQASLIYGFLFKFFEEISKKN